VPQLLNVLAEADEVTAKAMRKYVERMSAPEVDDAIASLLEEENAAIREEAAESLKNRGAKRFARVLLGHVRDKDPHVRAEVLRALAVLAEPEHLDELLSLLVDSTFTQDMDLLVDATVAVAKRDKSKDPVNTIVNFFPQTRSIPIARAATIRIMGELGDSRCVPSLRNSYKERDRLVKEAAIRALANWPSPEVLNDLEYLSRRTPDGTLRTVALRGYIRLLAEPGQHRNSKIVGRYKKAFRRCTAADEKRAVIAGLVDLAKPEALRVLADLAKKETDLREDLAKARAELHKVLLHVSASENTEDLRLAVDGDETTLWSSARNQEPGMWLQLDFVSDVAVRKITFKIPKDYADSPDKLTVQVLGKKGTSVDVAAVSAPPSNEKVFALPDVECRSLRILLTEPRNSPWKINEISFEIQP